MQCLWRFDHEKLAWSTASEPGRITMRMFVLCSLLLVVAGIVAPAPAMAQTLTDWTGKTATLTEGVFDSNGLEMHYHTVGEGPLMVMLHGLGGAWFDYRHQIPSLATRYQVAVLTLRGTNMSAKPTGVENYTVAKVAEDIKNLITHLNRDKAIVLGQDSGGFYAWNFAMHYPEMTDRLISIGSYHPAGLIQALVTDPSATAWGWDRVSGRILGQEADGVEEPGARAQRQRPQRPQDSDEIHAMRLEQRARTLPEAMTNFFRANWPRPPFNSETEGFGYKVGNFPQVQAPTLLFFGEDDSALGATGLNDIWKWVDNAVTLVVIPGIGHGPHDEAPEYVTPRLMDWLVESDGD